ncbi:MAG: DNA-3-methyladenine glycosylase 2 family protein [Alphaproteobacteria bacterium]|nr:DNA-3-methyladenine glycosylase 2 family protein [Alphaproteobacteria bacterium]
MIPKPFSWDRNEARAGKFDGRFLIGVLTTSIYCLPSCPARQPKTENVKLFRSEAEAIAAGLRACKRCRPDLYYRGEDSDLQLFNGLIARIRRSPQDYADAGTLTRVCGVRSTKLGELFRTHAHMTPAAFLRRERIRRACDRLMDRNDRVIDIGLEAGFESESVFHRQFVAHTRMTPGAWRALKNSNVFFLHLPHSYRAQEVLAYHGRDPQSRCERVEENCIFKALELVEGAAVLEISLEGAGAWCRLHPQRPRCAQSMCFVHDSALRMLGLYNDVGGIEARMARNSDCASLFAMRRGLRLSLVPTGFDALCWAIIGQQINVPFAAALRREIVELAGEKIGDMCAHPSPQRVANIDIRSLTARRYSRSKAEYLTLAAGAVARKEPDLDALQNGSAITAEKSLRALRGVGRWTAGYQMLRTGFADAAPIGDAALAAALQRWQGLNERPDHDQVEEMMQVFAPYRALATAHLWASLKKEAA